MINAVTNQPLRVLGEGVTGPYLRLPESQLEEVREILDRHGISYRVDEVRISMGGRPFNALIYFGRKGDPDTIQRILDGGQ